MKSNRHKKRVPSESEIIQVLEEMVAKGIRPTQKTVLGMFGFSRQVSIEWTVKNWVRDNERRYPSVFSKSVALKEQIEKLVAENTELKSELNSLRNNERGVVDLEN